MYPFKNVIFNAVGVDRSREDGHQHGVRVLNEGQQVCLQDRN
jgi:hypothetical protein